MMCSKFIGLFGMALALLAGAACSREEMPSAGNNVTISFRVGEPTTRAVAPGDGNVADGGGVYCTKDSSTPPVFSPDLYIFICDWDTGAIVSRYPGDGTVEPESEWLEGDKSTFLSVAFSLGEEGVYSVYALANVGGGGNVALPSAGELAAMTNASQLEALYISLSEDALDVGTRMPLSAKGILNVARGLNPGKYNGYVELELLRCVNKVQFCFKNLTGSTLDLYDCRITFKDLNVQRGWLFPASPDFVEMGDSEDEGDLDDNYRDYVSPPRNVTGIADQGEAPLFDSAPVLFLPSVAPMQTRPSKGQRYLCNISFRVQKDTEVPYDAEDPSTYVEKSFTNLPIHTPKSEDIKSLVRNQYLQIVTTVSLGMNVSFNFMVREWDEHKAYVTFD